MSNTAVFSTPADVSTAVSRTQQPKAVLTPKQREDIERTWKMVESDEIGLMNAGILLFKNIFTICPPAQKMFKSFADAPFEELPEIEEFRSHALQVTETISVAVSSLDDLETLSMVLKDLGQAHSPQGLQDVHFDIVGQALILTLEAGLGEKFTQEVKEAYLAFYGIVTKNMKEGLNA